MNLVELLCSHWAILPDRLAELRDIYAAHMRGTLDLAAVEARMGRELSNEQKDYQMGEGGVATLSVEGVMAPKANLLMRVSGGVSTQMLARQFDSMAEDPRVRAVLIRWDSPGGNVIAVPAAATALRRLADAKPTVSLVEGAMASAAYWVGSAVNAIYMEGVTDLAGSLGVVQRLSWDAANPNSTELVRGTYKRLSVNGQPPSAEVLAYLNAQLDYLYAELIDAVAAHRGTTAEDVLARMADGKVFVGQQAIDAGLVDGFATAAELADRLATEPDAFRPRRRATRALALPPVPSAALVPLVTTGDAPMDTTKTEAPTAALTREALQAQHPALFAALQTEFTAAGASAERVRIQAVRAQALPGHEALIERLAFDGQTTGDMAAIAIVRAERDLRGSAAAQLAADAPKPAAPAATPAVDAVAAQDDPAQPIEARCEAAWAASAALQAEFSGDYAAYLAYAKAESKGKVRRLASRNAA